MAVTDSGQLQVSAILLRWSCRLSWAREGVTVTGVCKASPGHHLGLLQDIILVFSRTPSWSSPGHHPGHLGVQDGVGGCDLRGGEGGGEHLGHRGHNVFIARLLRNPLQVLERRSCIKQYDRVGGR